MGRRSGRRAPSLRGGESIESGRKQAERGTPWLEWPLFSMHPHCRDDSGGRRSPLFLSGSSSLYEKRDGWKRGGDEGDGQKKGVKGARQTRDPP